MQGRGNLAPRRTCCRPERWPHPAVGSTTPAHPNWLPAVRPPTGDEDPSHPIPSSGSKISAARTSWKPSSAPTIQTCSRSAPRGGRGRSRWQRRLGGLHLADEDRRGRLRASASSQTSASHRPCARSHMPTAPITGQVPLLASKHARIAASWQIQGSVSKGTRAAAPAGRRPQSRNQRRGPVIRRAAAKTSPAGRSRIDRIQM
jgi:hypothetical protein